MSAIDSYLERRKQLDPTVTAKLDVIQHLAVDLFVGLGWLALSEERTRNPAYDPIKHILSAPPYQMRTIGAMLVGFALLLIIGIVIRSQWVYDIGRILLMSYWVGFGFIFGYAFFLDGKTSPLSVAWGIAWAIRSIRLPTSNPFQPQRHDA